MNVLSTKSEFLARGESARVAVFDRPGGPVYRPGEGKSTFAPAAAYKVQDKKVATSRGATDCLSIGVAGMQRTV